MCTALAATPFCRVDGDATDDAVLGGLTEVVDAVGRRVLATNPPEIWLFLRNKFTITIKPVYISLYTGLVRMHVLCTFPSRNSCSWLLFVMFRFLSLLGPSMSITQRETPVKPPLHTDGHKRVLGMVRESEAPGCTPAAPAYLVILDTMRSW